MPTRVALALLLGACRVSTPEDAPDIPAPAPVPASAGCSTDADCPADTLCEGEGCEGGGGTCVARNRMCTRDAQLYCGCDGVEFRASGSCPARRFRSRGPCETPT